jgi:positive phototaxis protein PixI
MTFSVSSRNQNLSSQQTQFLTFTLSQPENQSGKPSNDHPLMLPTSKLVEILNLSFTQITPIPDTAAFVMGVCNWRGEVVWVVDLAFKLGFEPIYRQGFALDACNVILLQGQDMVLGLAVKKVGQMFWCDPSKVLPIPPTLANSELTGYLQGYLLAPNGETVLVLDTDGLIQTFD